MANKLPKNIAEQVRAKIYERADEFGYTGRSRTENSQFMDDLIDDPEIGGIIKSFYPAERVRTYIKDAVLNAYTKARNRELLNTQDINAILLYVFGVETEMVQKLNSESSLHRAEDGRLIVVSKGTYVKWETALRRALESIAKSKKLTAENDSPLICLLLAVVNGEATEADKKFIKDALGAINVGVYFC